MTSAPARHNRRADPIARATLNTMETAYIGMGGNLPTWAGPPEATLAEALHWLAQLGRITRCSSLYSTAPVGFADQPRFVNAAVALETELSPRQLLGELLQIERKFGRDRSSGIQNGPRTLDLDLLLYGDLVIRETDLEIPHPRLAERVFVLAPLADIAPGLIEITRQASVAELLHNLQAQSDAIYPVESDAWPADAPGEHDDAAGAGNADADR